MNSATVSQSSSILLSYFLASETPNVSSSCFLLFPVTAACDLQLGENFPSFPSPPAGFSRVGFLTPTPVGIWGRKILCGEGRPGHCRMLNGIPDPYPLDARRVHPPL